MWRWRARKSLAAEAVDPSPWRYIAMSKGGAWRGGLDPTRVLAYTAFPSEHWRQIWSTNPLERLNKEIKPRVNVVGIFTNRQAAIRLVGAVLIDQHEEWAIARRYFSQDSVAKIGALPPGGAFLTAAL